MNDKINELARIKGNWSEDYQVFKLEAVGRDRVRLTGDRPIGFRIDNGSPIFPTGREREIRTVTISIEDYRKAYAQPHQR